VTPKGQGRDPIIFEAPYFDNSARQTERQFPTTISMPVTISIILDRSQINAESLIQVESNKKALRKTRSGNNVRKGYIRLVTI